MSKCFLIVIETTNFRSQYLSEHPNRMKAFVNDDKRLEMIFYHHFKYRMVQKSSNREKTEYLCYGSSKRADFCTALIKACSHSISI